MKTMRHARSFLLGAALLVSCSTPAQAQLSLGDVIDFEDGGPGGFTGAQSFQSLSVISDPNGDDTALQISTSGNSGGPGSNLVATLSGNSSDFLSSGITAISFDAFNPNPVELNVRIGLTSLSPLNSSFVSEDLVLPAGASETLTFSLDEESLISLSGTASLASVLSDVDFVQVLHNPATQAGRNQRPIGDAVLANGSPIAGSLIIDNFTAVPEPASAALLALATTGLLIRYRQG